MMQIKGTARAILWYIALWLGQYHDIAQWYTTGASSNSDTILVYTCYYCGDTNQLTHLTSAIWNNALVCNHIQPLGFALVLYVVTALMHYIPYSTCRGTYIY